MNCKIPTSYIEENKSLIQSALHKKVKTMTYDKKFIVSDVRKRFNYSPVIHDIVLWRKITRKFIQSL